MYNITDFNFLQYIPFLIPVIGGFLDSTSSVIDAVLTRKGRELLAKNDGSFMITKFAFGDDEINYQLYDSVSDNDTDILNLPVLEPSTNENTVLRYRLVTMPKGSVQVAYISVNPSSVVLFGTGTTLTQRPQAAIIVNTIGGHDHSYTVFSKNTSIATVRNTTVTVENNESASNTVIFITAGTLKGNTTIEIIGNDTGSKAVVSVTNQFETVRNSSSDY